MMTCQGRLPKAIARTLLARGFRRLTPVQWAVLQVEAPDADLLVSARTGSGKTIAFGLALARRLLGSDGRCLAQDGPQALVVTPTRELAWQVRDELAWLFAATGARVGACTGGRDPRPEREMLGAGIEVLVGTPGRLNDHIRTGALATGQVASLVLDEADGMLGPDFRAELEAVLHALPTPRQTLMFSATIGAAAEALARRFQTGALRIDAGGAGAAGTLRLQGVAVTPGDREAAIVNLLRLHEAPSAIVFCARREAVAHLAQRLATRGFAVAALSGALSQRSRTAALAAMRDGRARVCVATDLAARGIDLPGLDLVLHADLPPSAEMLLHRSGRTGRAGRGGLAILVAPRALQRRAEALAARAGLAIGWVPPPDRAEVLARDLERMLAEPELGGAPSAGDALLAAGLLAAHGPERIAAAYGRLWSAGRPAPEELGATSRPRRRRPAGVWFAVGLGPGEPAAGPDLLPLICRLGRVAPHEIRGLRVLGGEAQVEVSRAASRSFLAAAAGSAEGRAVRRLPDPPPSAGGPR